MLVCKSVVFPHNRVKYIRYIRYYKVFFLVFIHPNRVFWTSYAVDDSVSHSLSEQLAEHSAVAKVFVARVDEYIVVVI